MELGTAWLVHDFLLAAQLSLTLIVFYIAYYHLNSFSVVPKRFRHPVVFPQDTDAIDKYCSRRYCFVEWQKYK